MTDCEELALAKLFIEEPDRNKLYGRVKDFLSEYRSNDRSRILSLIKPLMGGDHEQDRRIWDQIMNGA